MHPAQRQVFSLRLRNWLGWQRAGEWPNSLEVLGEATRPGAQVREVEQPVVPALRYYITLYIKDVYIYVL